MASGVVPVVLALVKLANGLGSTLAEISSAYDKLGS
jgi:hypothetical protein